MSRRTFGACAGVLVAIGICTLPFRDTRGEARAGETRASSPAPALRAHLRDEALRHARTRLRPSTPLGTGHVDHRALTSAPPDPTGVLTGDTVSCQFVPSVPDGTTSKFDCKLTSGEIVRVKYGHEPEIHAEAAATRLLSALGYAVDHIYVVPRLRCHGCPTSNPFATMHFLDVFRSSADRSAVPSLGDGDYRDFEWAGVERKFDAPPIEDDTRKGWAWWELDHVSAPADDLDALRLIAIFLAHWDNKSENQRLVCMDNGYDGSAGACRDSLLMLNDLGATFGPPKVNLSQWRETPVWIDRATCTISMRMLPFGGSTFTDARVTDAARLRVGRQLASFSDDELRQWFSAARFPQFYAATDDGKDLAGWIRAYRARVTQMLNAGPCPQGA